VKSTVVLGQRVTVNSLFFNARFVVFFFQRREKGLTVYSIFLLTKAARRGALHWGRWLAARLHLLLHLHMLRLACGPPSSGHQTVNELPVVFTFVWALFSRRFGVIEWAQCHSEHCSTFYFLYKKLFKN
jgi:hypothetical protein